MINNSDKYSHEEWEKLNDFIDHDRDYLFTYAGIRQVADKYLIQDRSTGEIYETPQFMYIMIAATLFQDDDKFYRLEYVKKYYDAISKHRLNIPTPIMAGVRTPLRQFASCVLVDVDDTLDSIFSSDMAIGYYVAQSAGIGINAGRIRGINAKIRGGEVQHTGVIPFLKKFEATVRCCTQNGIRGGSATVHFPIWHQEIEDILVLKNNKGTEDNRVRKLDYSVFKLANFSTNVSSKMERSHSSVLMTCQVCMMLLGLIHLTTYMLVTNQMSLFLERLSGLKNSFWIF